MTVFLLFVFSESAFYFLDFGRNIKTFVFEFVEGLEKTLVCSVIKRLGERFLEVLRRVGVPN